MKSSRVFQNALCAMLVLSWVFVGCAPAQIQPGDVPAAPVTSVGQIDEGEPAVVTAVPPTAAEPVAEPTTSPPKAESALITGGQVYHDDTYGFQFSYPADWTFKPFEMGGPGEPDDWPVEASVIFFPQAMEETFNRSGPPDPNVQAVPAFNLEVCVGPEAQFRRVYIEPGATETLMVNGVEVVVERDTREDFNQVRYVYTSPDNPELRVVIIDSITGFSERAAAHPEWVELIPKIAATFEFVGAAALPSPDPLASQTIEIVEAGLQLNVPASWQRRAPEWVWEPGAMNGTHLGVKWVDLQPPQEAEAALLPTPAQILDSEPVDLVLGPGRSFTMEVYASAAEGEDAKADVQAVEYHVLVKVSHEGSNRAYDFYASAPTAELLETVLPSLQVMLDTVTLLGSGGDVSVQLRDAVAAKLGVAPDAVQIRDVQPVEWPDACLGLPGEGELCAQVLTPGYSAMATVGAQVYEVRTNEDLSQVRLLP